jgi:hypothetical protein
MEMNSVPAEMNGGLWHTLADDQYLSSQTHECPQAVHCAFTTAATAFGGHKEMALAFLPQSHD